MTEPTTAAGRALLAMTRDQEWYSPPESQEVAERWILAIEAEAATLDVERLHTVTDSSGACTLPCPACQDIMRARHAESGA